MPLVWIDLETTGLHPERDHVLEFACIITDDKLDEVARSTHVVHHPRAGDFAALDPKDDAAIAAAGELHGVDPYVIRMHLANGLWAESARSLMRVSGRPTPTTGRRGMPDQVSSAEELLSHFIESTITEMSPPDLGEKRGPQLAGSTVSFDRAFLKFHMPKAHALLHYRNLDTTSLNELARRNWPKLHAARPSDPGGHRAVHDIEYSIAIAKYYALHLSPAVPTESAP